MISKDPQQKYLFVADGHNFVIWILDHQSGKTLGHFGGNGRLAGQLHFPNAVSIDSRGNVYTGEVDSGKRIHTFAPVMAGRYGKRHTRDQVQGSLEAGGCPGHGQKQREEEHAEDGQDVHKRFHTARLVPFTGVSLSCERHGS